MSTVVAVAGGSGGLGRAIVEALKEDSRYSVLIFSRASNPDLEKETGIPVFAADYSSVPSLVELLDEHKVQVLISTANTMLDATPEFNMIEAAEKSQTTKRYIANAWSSIEFKDEPRFQSFPLSRDRIKQQSQLRQTTLEWTAIYPGLFMEYLVDDLPSTLTKIGALIIDTAHNAAALPNKGTSSITATYTRDIAKYIPGLLALPKWENTYYVAGDVKSWNDIVAAAEKGKGVKFDVKFDSLEMLREGKISELPGYAGLYDAFGGREIGEPAVKGILSQYALWMEEGLFTFKGGVWLNEVFPEIEILNLEKAWEFGASKRAA